MQAYQGSSASANSGSSQVITPDQQREFGQFLAEQGQESLLPMLKLFQESDAPVNELMDALSKVAVEAMLQLSAEQVAGAKQQGKHASVRPIRHHGTQDGIVELAERKLSVKRPRLRKREGGDGAEVPIPAYEQMRHSSHLGKRMLQILMEGVSTRRYERVLPAMADSLGISKSAVSRQIIEEGEKVLKELSERRFDDKEILIIYVDGMEFAGHHILAAVGVDIDGYKHVLGISQGAAENTVTVTALLEGMVQRGIKADRRRLFVIDGAKALRAAINRVYGSDNPVQRCRNHKLRNVIGHLPEEQQDQAKAALRAAWKLDAKLGIARLEQLARWYEKDQPGAAASIREGLDEMFTLSRMGLPRQLCRCLWTTNLIDSGHSAVRRATKRVTRWRNGSMALRWAATAFAAAERRFSKLQGCGQLWMLKAHLEHGTEIEEKRQAG
jgi:putative transposase